MSEVGSFVPPSQRKYGSDALKAGWRISGVKNGSSAMAKSVRDFLCRTDQTSSVIQAEKSGPCDASPQLQEAASEKHALHATVRPTMSTSTHQTGEADVTFDAHRPKNIDEVNASQLSNLLRSFTFNDEEPQGDGKASILEDFLALLAENPELPKELEQGNRSCARKMIANVCPVEARPDELTKGVFSELESEPPSKKHAVKATFPAESPQTDSYLSPRAIEFVPGQRHIGDGSKKTLDLGHQAVAAATDEQGQHQLPFTGYFHEPTQDGLPSSWSPPDRQLPAVPTVDRVVRSPVQPVRSDGKSNDSITTTLTAAPMRPRPVQGLAASRWANHS